MIDIPIALRIRVYEAFRHECAESGIPQEQSEHYLERQERENRHLGEILAQMAKALGMKSE